MVKSPKGWKYVLLLLEEGPGYEKAPVTETFSWILWFFMTYPSSGPSKHSAPYRVGGWPATKLWLSVPLQYVFG